MEIKGYDIGCGWMGYCPDNERAKGNGYVLFATENDYLDYVAEMLADTREN